MGKLSRATISREKSWFASPCMGWIMIGSFDRLCGWYLGMAYGRESHIDAPSHEISYNTTNPSHTQMLVPRQIPPFYGSMIIIIDWIWLWDPTSIPFPEKGIHIVCSPLLWLRAFSFFFMVETWNCFFLESAWYIRISPRFLLQTIELIETNLLELQSTLDFPVCLLYPHDIPWPTVRSGASWRARTASGLCRPKLWNSHRMGPPPCSSAALLSSCNAAVERFQCCASWLRFGRLWQWMPRYLYNTQTNWFTNSVTLVHMDWQLPIKDGHLWELHAYRPVISHNYGKTRFLVG